MKEAIVGDENSRLKLAKLSPSPLTRGYTVKNDNSTTTTIAPRNNKFKLARHSNSNININNSAPREIHPDQKYTSNNNQTASSGDTSPNEYIDKSNNNQHDTCLRG
jgi:hypothetical protein